MAKCGSISIIAGSGGGVRIVNLDGSVSEIKGKLGQNLTITSLRADDERAVRPEDIETIGAASKSFTPAPVLSAAEKNRAIKEAAISEVRQSKDVNHISPQSAIVVSQMKPGVGITEGEIAYARAAMRKYADFDLKIPEGPNSASLFSHIFNLVSENFNADQGVGAAAASHCDEPAGLDSNFFDN